MRKDIDTRLKRFHLFLESDFIHAISRNSGYSFSSFDPELLSKIKNKHFTDIVFVGMGCSGIVCSMLKGFLIHAGVDIKIEVVNDFNIDRKSVV